MSVCCRSTAVQTRRPFLRSIAIFRTSNPTPVEQTTDRELGSALILLPTIVIVITFISALTVSQASLFLAQRELFAIAQSAANNGVSAIDVERFRTTGEYVVAPSSLETFVRAHVLQRRTDLVTVDDLQTSLLNNSTVEVRLTGTAPTVFLHGIPGVSYRLSARATARAIERG